VERGICAVGFDVLQFGVLLWWVVLGMGVLCLAFKPPFVKEVAGEA